MAHLYVRHDSLSCEPWRCSILPPSVRYDSFIRNREKKREITRYYICIHVYVYIYIYSIYLYMYIYIYYLSNLYNICETRLIHTCDTIHAMTSSNKRHATFTYMTYRTYSCDMTHWTCAMIHLVVSHGRICIYAYHCK